MNIICLQIQFYRYHYNKVSLVYIDTTLDINISHSIVDVLLDATSMFIENIDLQEQILFTVSNIITTDGKFLISLVDIVEIIVC